MNTTEYGNYFSLEEELPMADILKVYFPNIRSREELLQRIRKDEELLEMFVSWEEERQEEFLDMCTGNKGVIYFYKQGGII